MKLKGMTDEDFLQYKKPSLLLVFPTCTFKCCIECGSQVCQNWSLAMAPMMEVSSDTIIQRYLSNPITQAIVCGGLEPFDSFDELFPFIVSLREDHKCEDDIVIYTGYKEEEINSYINKLKAYKNIIVKFGRFVPDQDYHHDDILGVDLASDNQYAVKIS